MSEQIICAECGSYQIEEGYAKPLCRKCREKYVKYPVPIWIKIISLIIIGIVIFSLFKFPISLNAAVAYERGVKAESEKKYVTAEREYKKVVETFPNSTKAVAKLYVAYVKNDNLEKASKVFTKIEGEKLDDKELLNQVNDVNSELSSMYSSTPELRKILESNGNKSNTDTLNKLQEYSKKNPSDSMAYLYTGSILFDMGKYNEAKEVYLKAAKINPKTYSINLNLAAAYRQLGEYNQAIGECRKVLDNNIESAQAYSALSKIELKRHNYKEALLLAKKAYEFDKTNLYSINNIAIVYHYNKMDKERDEMFAILKSRGYNDLNFTKGIFEGKINIYD